jgi:hypothetical protein
MFESLIINYNDWKAIKMKTNLKMTGIQIYGIVLCGPIIIQYVHSWQLAGPYLSAAHGQ